MSKGPGYWNLNTSILKDENFKREINNIIITCCNSNVKSAVLKWEILKIKREFAQRHGKKTCRKKGERANLERDLANIELNLDKQNDIRLREEYVRTKEKLEKVYKDECRRWGKITSKMDGRGRKKHKLFFIFAKKKSGENRVISQLKTNGKQKVVTDHQQILKEVKCFYEALYRDNCIDLDCMHDYVYSQEVEGLSQDDKEKCEGLMNLQECKR